MKKTEANDNHFSNKYKLMIYFAHSTMVIYSKSIISHKNMTVGEFIKNNDDVIKRVFDEGHSIMNYELSHNQMCKAVLLYLKSKYQPTLVSETEVFIPNKIKNK